jgi:tetratricopeptide (TPR) repeat protein
MLFYAATTIDKIGEVKKLLYGEISAIKQGLITDGELDAAKKELISAQKIAMETNADQVRAYSNLGMIYMQKKEHLTAIPYFEKSIRTSPDYGAAYAPLALAHEMRGDMKRAKYWYEQSVNRPAFNPNVWQSALRLGNIYLREENIPMAKQWYRKALEINPDSASAKSNLDKVMRLERGDP